MQDISDVPYLRQQCNWLAENQQVVEPVKRQIHYAKRMGLPISRIAFEKDKILIHQVWYDSLNHVLPGVAVLEQSTKSYLAADKIDFDFIIAKWNQKVDPSEWFNVKRFIYQIINGATEYVINETLSSRINNGGNLTLNDVFERAFFVNDALFKLKENIDCTSSLLKSILSR